MGGTLGGTHFGPPRSREEKIRNWQEMETLRVQNRKVWFPLWRMQPRAENGNLRLSSDANYPKTDCGKGNSSPGQRKREPSRRDWGGGVEGEEGLAYNSLSGLSAV